MRNAPTPKAPAAAAIALADRGFEHTKIHRMVVRSGQRRIGNHIPIIRDDSDDDIVNDFL